MGHDKSLDKKSILETMHGWLKAPEDDDPKKIEKYNKAKETLGDLMGPVVDDLIPPVPGHRGFNKAMDDNPLSSEFNKAMDMANPDGKHKKENWSSSPKKTVDRRINSIIDETEDEEINIDLKGIQKRYIFIKGIPVPSKVEDLYIWLKVSHKENVYFCDEALKESIVIEFEEDGNEFPLELKIELWYKGYPDVKFERIGIFPADESIKRVSTDLSVRGREVKGVTAGSQESIKKFLKRAEEEKKEEAKREAVLNGMAGVGNPVIGTSAIPGGVGSGTIVGSGVWSTSAVGISATAIGGTISNGLDDSILTDDSDLTENMEESIEKKIKTAVNDLRDEIRNEIFEDFKEEIQKEIEDGNITFPKGLVDPNFENISLNTQIYDKQEMEDKLIKVINREKKLSNPDHGVDIQEIGLGNLIASTGIPSWEAEDRIEDFLKKVVKGEYDKNNLE